MRDLPSLTTSIALLAALALVAPAYAEETSEATPSEEAATEAAVAEEPTPAEAEAAPVAEPEAEEAEAEGEAEAEAEADAEPEVEAAPVVEEEAAGEAVAVETVEAVAETEVVEVVEVAPEADVKAEGPTKPWSVNVGVGTSMSMMLFHPTRYVRSSMATFIPSVSVGGSYQLKEQVTASGNWGFSYELTTPGSTSKSDFLRRFNYGDPTLGLAHGSLYKDEKVTGINVSGSASVGLGLSRMSITATQLFSLGASVSAGRSFLDDKLSANLSVTGGLPFNRYTSPVVRQQWRDGVWACQIRESGNEAVNDSQCATGDNNGMANVGLNLGVSYQFTDKLGGMLNFGLSRSWSYPIPVDEFSSQIVDSKGNLVVDSTITPSDAMMGGLGLTYRLPGKYMLSANLMTGGPLFRYLSPDLDDENRVLRFPFWDSSLMRTGFSLRVGRSF